MIVMGLARMLRIRAIGAFDSMVQIDEADGAMSYVCDTMTGEAAIIGCSIAHNLRLVMEGLDVDPAAMRRNLDGGRGLIMTEAVMMKLAPEIGRNKAHDLLYDVAMDVFEKGEALKDALAARPDIRDSIDIDAVLDPANYLGESAAIVEAAAARWPKKA
jgi:3-carboxy-cis,cis-muconate cycloisomerase